MQARPQLYKTGIGSASQKAQIESRSLDDIPRLYSLRRFNFARLIHWHIRMASLLMETAAAGAGLLISDGNTESRS